MTDAELKIAERLARSYKGIEDFDTADPDEVGLIIDAFLALLAKEAARGETREVCPKCQTLLIVADMVQSGWRCHACWEYFHTPDYYQRIPSPEAKA